MVYYIRLYLSLTRSSNIHLSGKVRKPIYCSPYLVQFKDTKYYETKMKVKIKPKNYLRYPYMDTFGRYDERSGTLYNDTNKSLGGHILRRTDGSILILFYTYRSVFLICQIFLKRKRQFLTSSFFS